MFGAASKFKLFALATKYGVEVQQFTPGNVTVKIGKWYAYEGMFGALMEIMREDAQIDNITENNGVVQVQFDSAVMNDQAVIARWMGTVERLGF